MFTLLSPSKDSPFEAMQRSRNIFLFSKQCWSSCEVMSFYASVVFTFTSSTYVNSVSSAFVPNDELRKKSPDQLPTVFFSIHESHSMLTVFNLPWANEAQILLQYFSVAIPFVGRSSDIHQSYQQVRWLFGDGSPRLIHKFSYFHLMERWTVAQNQVGLQATSDNS